MFVSTLRSIKLITAAGLITIVSACGDSGTIVTPPVVQPPTPPAMEYQYQVSVTNLTNAQPFSPLAVLLHSSGTIWQFGQPASAALEDLAESGNNAGVLSSSFMLSNASNNGILAPGEQTDVMISTTDTTAKKLSLATMLVNTNDAFTGISNIELSQLAVGDTLTFRATAYDAGTEANSEAAGTIPGPVDGGEGTNSQRDDVNYVSRHPGVVGSDDGSAVSVLNNQHKFDNPVMSVKIMRMQ